MLSREVMGIACLCVVWVTALLVAAAALQDLADLRRIAKRARRAIVGTAIGDVAEWRVEQTGRAVDAPVETIAFHDRRFGGEIFASQVRTGSGAIDIAPSDVAHVWLSREARDAAAACPSDAEFSTAFAQARKAKGFVREVRARVTDGARIFVVPAEEMHRERVIPEIVSTIDPVAFCKRKALLIVAFIPLELVACAAATALALYPPHFGRVSIAGAVACFAFFLGVTPLAVALRENGRRPHDAFLRTEWRRARNKSASGLRTENGLSQR